MENKEHLIPAKQGEVRNPNGKPKGTRNRSTIMRELLQAIMQGKDLEGNEQAMEVERVISIAQIRKAAEGDTNAYKAIADSAYGAPTQQIENTVKEGFTLRIGQLEKDNDRVPQSAEGDVEQTDEA